MLPALNAGDTLGRYTLIERIGNGGMAIVYRAHDPSLHRDVAIKVLNVRFSRDPEFASRFAIEAQTIARLRHPNILRIYDYGNQDGLNYIVTELLDGGTLEESLRVRMPPGRVLNLLASLADAVDYAHGQGIVHRDIKPSNVLLDGAGRPVLADFGLSSMIEEVYRSASPHETVGTPEYMSPEQAQGKDADEFSDLYSFAVLAYRMIVGETPFHAETPELTLKAHVEGPVTFPTDGVPSLTEEVRTALIRGTAKAPSDRFRTATALVNALARAVEGGEAAISSGQNSSTIVVRLPARGGEGAAASRPKRLRWRNWAGIAAAVPLIALLAFAGFRFFDPGGEAQSSNQPTPPAVTSTVPVVAPPSESPPPSQAAPPLAETLRTAEQVMVEISTIQANVTEMRGLSPTQPIEPRFLTSTELVALADTYFKRRIVREEVFETGEVFKALGLLEPGQDLEQITYDLLVGDVSALYDDQSGELYVLSDSPEFGPAEALSYASVYMAGLQEQHFGLANLRQQARDSDNLDALRAVTAFASGDVFQLQSGYVNTHFDSADLEQLRSNGSNGSLGHVPDAVRELVGFPRIEGMNFVFGVHGASGSWRDVNSVYLSPPQSTEHILHPEKYISGEQPDLPELPDVQAQLGRGWDVTSENTLGEFLIRTYLESQLDSVSASFAAAGWGGDRYVLLIGPTGERVFALLINWDSNGDESEFARFYRQFADAKTEGRRLDRIDDGMYVRWITAEGTICLKRGTGQSALVIADTDALAFRVADMFRLQ